MSVLNNRIEFVFHFDVTNGNPNGDPDAGNMPRVDPLTQKGLVTDVCLKRKIRNYVAITKDGVPGYDIYVREKAILNNQHARAYEASGLKSVSNKLPSKEEDARAVTTWMCKTFFDVRAFGAVMTTEVNCGQVRGPVQLTFAQSVDPIQTLNLSITRMAVTNEKDAEKERTMGDKNIVPYGLYRCHGFLAPHFAGGAKGTGFSEDDLELLWQALANMFDFDRSAARGDMVARSLIAFRHDSPLGNAPAHKLLELVRARRAGADPDVPPRSFADYVVEFDKTQVPAGVTPLVLI
ncbi:CRISPR-associated protein, Csd2 family [uncultured Alphaproteobacteria bacterium]|uniref:CRISPR-associated protein, Csd2 family n=1 Tax=uncultured Alphaproteobacteria bacterium TaxID=91750 RepID=A0A212JCV2_9PROT|nr:CRISPR-associated protein, Csd2 family [uncultured Alphaproteobacteria bacterium]